VRLVREPVEVPAHLPAGSTRIVPFHSGETLPWRFAGAA
jgi:dihydroorotase